MPRKGLLILPTDPISQLPVGTAEPKSQPVPKNGVAPAAFDVDGLRMVSPPGRSTSIWAYSPCTDSGPQTPAASKPQSVSLSPIRPVLTSKLPRASWPEGTAYWKKG